MYTFDQNAELTIPHAPLVGENSFLSIPADTTPLPTFGEIRKKLPVPVWEGHETYVNAYYKAWEIAFRNLRAPAPDTGFVSNFIDAAFNNHIFMWDSCFMLMFGKYADRLFRFQGTLDNFYSHQHKDGFICRAISEEKGTDRFTRWDPSATGPEVMPWCEWEYYLNLGDRERLAKVFPPLMAYHRWMREHLTWQDGSYFSTGWGCGMDNLPRLRPEYHTAFSHGHMTWVDSCMQEYLSCDVLLQMSQILGRSEFFDELRQEQELLDRIINTELWDEETGFYYDRQRDGQRNTVRHVGAFWGLLAGCAREERAARLISYLENEREFKTPTRVPALSRSHEKYSPLGQYWCGGVWAPTTYMVLKGLDRHGRYALSHEIGAEYLASVVDVYRESDTFFENYAPEPVNGKPAQGNIAGRDFVGWTGLAPISVLFEYVFGIKATAHKAQIEWHVELLERHGIEGYPFGKDGTLSLLCEARDSADETPRITLKSNVPVTLTVIWGKGDGKKTMTLKNE